MKPRLILVSLGLAALAILSLGLQAQEGPKAVTQQKDEITASEQQLMRQFTEFQTELLKLQQRLAKGTPEERQRAEVLAKVLDMCKDLAVNQEFRKMIELMRGAGVTDPAKLPLIKEQSDTIAKKLRDILDLMQNSTTKANDDVKKLQNIIKKLDAAIQIQKTVEQITGGKKTEKTEVQKNQEYATKKADDVAKAIKDFMDKKDGKNDKGGEAAKPNGEVKGAGKESKDPKGEAKNDGKQSPEGAKGAPKDAGKDSKGAKGETKPGQDKNAPPKSGEGEPKAGAKGGDKSPEGAPPPAGAKGDKGDKASKNDQGKAKDKGGDKGPMTDKNKQGAPKDAGKTGDPKKDSPQGAAKGDDKKAGGDQKPPQGAPDSKAKPGGGAPMPGGGAQKPPVASKESKGADKGGEGKSGGDAKGGDGKQGEAKSGDSKSGQGSAKEGGASPAGGGDPKGSPPPAAEKGGSPPPPPSGDPKKKDSNDDVANSHKKVKEAGYDQKKAEDEIAKAQIEKALKNQADAIQKMEDAKKKLEKLLRQMREEEIERVLAALKARCEKMLQLQQQVLAGTIDTDAAIQKNADKKPDRPNRVASQALSDKEKEIVLEADKCIQILEGEGSAVAFPEVFQQLREDMKHVQKRLDLTDVGDVTQGIEKDIIASLKDMIKALEEAKKENDDNKDSKPGKAGKSGPPPDPKLLELIQELKMVRALQKRVNDRTEMYGKRYPGEQANDPQVVRELRELSSRQQRIQDIVSRIAKGDNK